MGIFSPHGHWWRFCFLVWLWFVARGVVFVSAIPPLEMWDEIQHVAYVHRIAAGGEPPILYETAVSRDVLRAAATVPQSSFGVHRSIGAVTYKEFFAGKQPSYREDHGEITFYQAQHGPLYYRLVTGVYRWAGGHNHLANTTAWLRMTGLLSISIALLLVLAWLGRAVVDRTHAGVLAILVAAQPLYLLNGLRVANDVLAIPLGTALITWVLLPGSRRPIIVSAAMGALAGVGVLAKATNASLVLFALIVLLIDAWRGRKSNATSSGTRLSSFGVPLVFLAAALAITGWTFWDNFDRYGVPIPMQEVILNRRAGKGLAEVFQAAFAFNWPLRLYQLVFTESIWNGGWSFLSASSSLKRWAEVLIVTASAGMAASWPAPAPLPARHVRRVGHTVEATALGVLHYRWVGVALAAVFRGVRPASDLCLVWLRRLSVRACAVVSG